MSEDVCGDRPWLKPSSRPASAMTEAGPFVTGAVTVLVGGVAARFVAGDRSDTCATVIALFGEAVGRRRSGSGSAIAGVPARSAARPVTVVESRYRESLARAASIGFVDWVSVRVDLALLSGSGSEAVLSSISGESTELWPSKRAVRPG